MKTLRSSLIGIAQGKEDLFSDFMDGGPMWTGEGAREKRKRIEFDRPFMSEPVVHASMALIDVHSGPNFRADIAAENIDRFGFDLVFRTWMDSRVARMRLSWLAIGETASEDDWDV